MLKRRNWLVGVALLGMSVVLAGCGVVRDTIDGMSGSGAPTSSSSGEPNAAIEDITVTVQIESDAPTASDLVVDIDSPRHAQSLREDSVETPFAQDFVIPVDGFFPLRGVTVDVGVGPGGTFVSCSIAVDGDVVTTHRAEGSSAMATCERSLFQGPQ